MIARVLNDKYQTIEKLKAEPVCGQDFCDSCGDCLACCGGDDCYPDGFVHSWIVYDFQVAEWRTEHPDAEVWSP